MSAAIVGWAHTPFGKLNGESVESLIVRVASRLTLIKALTADRRLLPRRQPSAKI